MLNIGGNIGGNIGAPTSAVSDLPAPKLGEWYHEINSLLAAIDEEKKEEEAP